MGIKSTRNITRENAIERIEEVVCLISKKDYRGLERVSFESNYNLQEFVDGIQPFVVVGLEKWTNKMLEDIIDRPFFRFSMFDNYSVVDKL